MSSAVDASTRLDRRIKIKRDLIMLETTGGTYLSRGDQALLIKSEVAYRWLAVVAPYLDGRRSLSEICRGLPVEHHDALLSLVETLTSRGFAKDTGPPEPADLLDPQVERRFQSQIEFIDHFVDQPRRRFRDFRAASLLVTGTGEALRTAVIGLVRNGSAAIDVATAGPAGAVHETVAREVESLRRDGVDTTVRIGSVPARVDDGYDAVILCGDEASLPEALGFTRRCHGRGPVFLPAFVLGDRTILGPLVRPGVPPCWLCAQLRLTPFNGRGSEPAMVETRWRDIAVGRLVGTGREVPTPVAGMLGNAVAFEIFRHFTGALTGEAVGAVDVQYTRTLDSYHEELLPHPLCPVCRPSQLASPPAVDEPIVDPATADQETHRRSERLIAPHIGVLTELVDNVLEQTPLTSARLRFYPPTGPYRGTRRELTAFAVEDPLEARLNVVRAALREYVAQLSDHPGTRVASAAALARAGIRTVPPDELVTWSGLPFDDSAETAWVPGVALSTGEPHLVPAAAAYPLSVANNDLLVERTSAGSAVAPTRSAVIADGHASAYAYRALVDLVRGRVQATPVATQWLAADERLAGLDRSAGRLGGAVRLVELPGGAGTFTALAIGRDAHDNPLWTVGAGSSRLAAMHIALRDAVGLMHVRQIESATPELGHAWLPGFSPDPRLRVAPTAVPPDRPPCEAYFVDTTTPDIAGTGAMTAGTVLLRRPA